jgi:hypothetical protein
MDANNNGDRPTAKQLAYMRSLANRAGQTFTYPRTRGQASREIQRLKQAEPSSHTEREVERKEIADAIANGPGDAARVRGHEITGHRRTARGRIRCNPRDDARCGRSA